MAGAVNIILGHDGVYCEGCAYRLPVNVYGQPSEGLPRFSISLDATWHPIRRGDGRRVWQKSRYRKPYRHGQPVQCWELVVCPKCGRELAPPPA